MLNRVQQTSLCKPYKKETPPKWGLALCRLQEGMLLFCPQKRRAVSSHGKTKNETREVHIPMEAAQNITENVLMAMHQQQY